MRPAARYLITFLAGLVVGAGVAGFSVARHWKGHFANWQVGAIGDQAHVAREIYADRSKQLANQIRESLPMRVATIEQHFPEAQGKNFVYWLISDVYEASGGPVPASVKPILSALPPRETCKKPVKRAARGAA